MEIIERLARIRFKLLIAVGVLLVFAVVFAVSAGFLLWITAPRDKAKVVKNQIGMEFVSLSAGSFMMGSENGKPDEKPSHRVTISRDFLLGRYEVTQGEWKAVMGREHANFKGTNFPVQFVTWKDTQEFIARLNQTNDGYIYRLPTEAEWEYGCRAGTITEYADELQWGWPGIKVTRIKKSILSGIFIRMHGVSTTCTGMSLSLSRIGTTQIIIAAARALTRKVPVTEKNAFCAVDRSSIPVRAQTRPMNFCVRQRATIPSLMKGHSRNMAFA
jgi:hypothetical protein